MIRLDYVLNDGTSSSYTVSDNDDFGTFCMNWWWNLLFEDIASNIVSCSLSGTPTGSGSSEEIIGEGALTYSVFDQLVNLQRVDVSNLDVSGMTDFDSMFNQCKAPTIDISMWDMSHAKSCAGMFIGCSANTIYLPATVAPNGQYVTIDVGNSTTLQYMFCYCNNLQHVMTRVGATLPQHWKTGKVTNLERMFYECYNFKGLNGDGFKAYNWDVSKVTKMSEMFKRCFVLPSFGMDANFTWDCSSVTTMDYMFSVCYGLTDVHADKWIVTNRTTSMIDMFNMYHTEGYNSSALTSFNAPNWNVSNVVSFGRFFGDCNNLTFVNMANWGMNSAIRAACFISCPNLKTVVCDHDWNQEKPAGYEGWNVFTETNKLSGAIPYSEESGGSIVCANPTTGYFTSSGKAKTCF